MKPVAAIYSTFLQRAYDQIVHDVCLQRLNVVFAMDRAGLVGDDGPTHHGAFDIAYQRCLPNIVLMAPRDEAMLKHMLRTALIYEGGPIALRYPRGEGVGVPLPDKVKAIPIGRGEVLREGARVAIVGYGTGVQKGLEAADLLADGGIVIWTRGWFDEGPDPSLHLRDRFADAGFTEVSFTTPADARFRVGMHRLSRRPGRRIPLRPGERLFSFV
jgi:deoxyxylulose-5-phosphate synthase